MLKKQQGGPTVAAVGGARETGTEDQIREMMVPWRRGPVYMGLEVHGKDFGFYSEWDGQSLNYSEQRRIKTQFVSQKDPFGCCAEDRLLGTQIKAEAKSDGSAMVPEDKWWFGLRWSLWWGDDSGYILKVEENLVMGRQRNRGVMDDQGCDLSK